MDLCRNRISTGMDRRAMLQHGMDGQNGEGGLALVLLGLVLQLVALASALTMEPVLVTQAQHQSY